VIVSKICQKGMQLEPEMWLVFLISDAAILGSQSFYCWGAIVINERVETVIYYFTFNDENHTDH